MSQQKSQHIKCNWILIFLCLFIFIVVTVSPVSHTGSDPRGSLLLAQALIEIKSVKLDKYPEIEEYTSWQTNRKNGHLYYAFPIGTPISSIPFVWIETKVLNNDMNNRQHDTVAQKRIAGMVAVLIFLLLYLISSMYFTAGVSITASFVFWMGTSLSSTLGQALWSQNFASLYALLAIFLMVKIVNENKNIYWIFLGLALFMAYLTRPTMSLLSIAVILYIFFNHKRHIAIKTAILVGFLLGIFVLFSLSEYNQLLPDYYLPKRLESETFWTALYGNLFSPARGLFIFSPILLIFFLNTKGTYKIFKDDKTLLIIAVWVVLHLIVISKFPHWWGGGSYGPRLMIDVLPAIFLLLIILLSNSYKTGSLLEKKLVSLFLIITVPISIYFNPVQGLYNVYAGCAWNGEPSIDSNPEYLFDWKYPQFLHNNERHEQRIYEFRLKAHPPGQYPAPNQPATQMSYLEDLKPIIPKNSIAHNSNIVLYESWSKAESTHRWSLDRSSIIRFKIDYVTNLNGLLKLHVVTLGKQKIKLAINGHNIESQTVDSRNANITFKFDKNIIIMDEINTIKFEFPDAHKPDNGDQRVLAMALRSFSIE